MYRVMSYTQPVTPNAIERHYTARNLPCCSRGLDEYKLQTGTKRTCPGCSSSFRSDFGWCVRRGKSVNFELVEGLSQLESSEMCDFSLHSIKSRPAKVGDKLATRDFGTGTRGFAASEDATMAVCVLPGTELAFAHEIKRLS